MIFRGLGQDESIEEYWASTYVAPIPSEYGGLTPTLPQVELIPSEYGGLTTPELTPYTVSGPSAQDYSQTLAGKTSDAKKSLDAANQTLNTLLAAGASAAQIAVARSAVSSAQSAVTKAQQAQATQAAGGVSGCTATIIPGICNTYVYLGGAALGAVLLIALLKRR